MGSSDSVVDAAPPRMVRRSSSSSSVPAEIVPLAVLSSVRLELGSGSLASFVVDMGSLEGAVLVLDGYRTRSKPAKGERSRKPLDIRDTVVLGVVEAVGVADAVLISVNVGFGVVALSSVVTWSSGGVAAVSTIVGASESERFVNEGDTLVSISVRMDGL